MSNKLRKQRRAARRACNALNLRCYDTGRRLPWVRTLCRLYPEVAVSALQDAASQYSFVGTSHVVSSFSWEDTAQGWNFWNRVCIAER